MLSTAHPTDQFVPIPTQLFLDTFGYTEIIAKFYVVV